MLQSTLEWIVDHSDPKYIIFWIIAVAAVMVAVFLLHALFPDKGGVTTKDELDRQNTSRDMDHALQ